MIRNSKRFHFITKQENPEPQSSPQTARPRPRLDKLTFHSYVNKKKLQFPSEERKKSKNLYENIVLEKVGGFLGGGVARDMTWRRTGEKQKKYIEKSRKLNPG